jgi:glucose/arabinose dehydrogenase
MFACGMVGQQLARLTLQGQRVVGQETLAPQMGRIRDVRQGLDGYIYLVTEPGRAMIAFPDTLRTPPKNAGHPGSS